jgi:hypothetical protein
MGMNTAMDRNEITALGASLRPIDPKFLKKKINIQRVWYQGEESYFDVFFEIQNHQIVWFQFTLRGKILFWERENSTFQTGETNEFSLHDTTYYSASKLICPDSQPDLDFIQLVQSILQTRAGEEIFDRALALFQDK